MSGKKASEVNQLLRNGKNTRSGSVDMINSSYKKFNDSSEIVIGKIEKAKSALADMKLVISTAEQEFPDAAGKIKAELSAIKEQLSVLSTPSEVHKLKNEFKELNKKYEETDLRAEKVSSDLKRKISSQGRNDPWYCDDEYRAASVVSKEYSELRKLANSLNSELSLKTLSLNQLAARADKLTEQADRLIMQAKKLEEKAQQAAQLRADAGKAKNSVISDLKAIDAGIAKKFLFNEYTDLTNNINAFCALSDGEVVKRFSEFTSAVKNFSTELDKVYSEFLKRKGEVSALLSGVEQRLAEKIFSDPMNDFKAGDHEKMDIISFLKGFCAGKYTGDISFSLEKARSAFNAEDFDEAETTLASLSDLLNSASEYAASQHERQKIMLENTLAIRKTMQQMNYNISSKINKNADGVIESYNVICTAGGEEIVFENITVDADGKFGFGINHKEASSGHCQQSWKDIRNALAQDDIFIEDITKNGNSVIYSKSKTAAMASDSVRARG